MKIAFFVNSQTSDLMTVDKILKAGGYSVIKTSVFDEIDQAGRQASKLVLVFDDAKFAYKFCGEQPWSPDYETLRILFLGRRPIMNPDVSEKLTSVGLRLFTFGDEAKLENKILTFESPSDVVGDIEFSIVSDLENEPPKVLEPLKENETFKLKKKS